MNAVVEKLQLTVKMKFHQMLTGAQSIDFNPEWNNGTGYFDHAVRGQHAPKLANGVLVKTVDDYGRNIGIIGTSMGNIVVFDRFADKANSAVVYNGPGVLMRLLDVSSGALTQDDIEVLFGDGMMFPNVGKRYADLLAKFHELDL